MIIYLITNKVNGKQYVGQTITTVEERFKGHCKKRRRKKGDKYEEDTTAIGNAIQKYGKDNFTYEVWDVAKSIDELNNKEIFWIAELKTRKPNGYNLEKGGRNAIPLSAIKVTCIETGEVYKSINEAKRKTGIHQSEISAVIKGKKETAGGYHWELVSRKKGYEREAYGLKRVINLDTGEIFESIKEACDKYNVHQSNLIATCKGRQRTCKNQRWEYYDEDEKAKYAQEKKKPNRQKKQIRNLTTGKIYESMKEACNDTGCNMAGIRMACNGEYKHSGGYEWEYVDKKQKDKDKNKEKGIVKKVMNVTTGKIYSSISEASKDTGLQRSGISKTCSGKQKDCGGHIWRLVE